jgi:hypothetical protein
MIAGFGSTMMKERSFIFLYSLESGFERRFRQFHFPMEISRMTRYVVREFYFSEKED